MNASAIQCQLCGQTELSLILDMGFHPPSDNFLDEGRLSQKESFYPLELMICDHCELVQLSHTVDPEELFTDEFVYRTAHNETLKNQFEELVNDLVSELNLGKDDLVVDIGSNDGTLLSFYPEPVQILGVDPSKASSIAIDNQIPTIQEFFGEEIARRIVQERSPASVITCTNTFAHVSNLEGLVEGVKTLLAEDGVFIQESHYFLDMVEKLQFDEIYLEHLRYYTLTSLKRLFDRFEMEIFRAERVPSHGGSIRTYAAKKDKFDIEESVTKLQQAEMDKGLNSKPVLDQFSKQAKTNKLELINLLSRLKMEQNQIVGVGAAAKGMSLLNFCHIGPDIIDYIAETNDMKIGKYSPGTHIPIVDEEKLLEDQPDYALLLAWNLKDVIIPKLRDKGFGGEFVLPNPEVKVIEA